MWLVVGLGNPGKKYTNNRHNIGFMVADELARRHDLPAWQEKFGGELTSGRIGNDRVLVLKPMEYMNLSGFAVTRTAQYYKVEPSEIVVVHDEIDLPFARIRVKSGGGHGGHNGLRSIVEQLGSRSFARIRLGVGKPAPRSDRPDGRRGDRRVSSHVLSDFGSDQRDEVEALVRLAADAVESIMDEGIREAMNKFNGLGKKPKGGDDEKETAPTPPKSGRNTDPRG